MNGDDYDQGATVRDARYRTAYAAWVAGLPADTRKDLQRRRLLAPDLGTSLGNAAGAERTQDAAEAAEASETVDMAALLDTIPDFLQERMGLSKHQAGMVGEWHVSVVKHQGMVYQAWVIERLVGGLLNNENVRVAAGGLAFATNLASLNGMGSMTAWAAKSAVTRAAVSKSTKWWERELMHFRSVHMKTPKACLNFRAAAVGPRKRKCPSTLLTSSTHNTYIHGYN